MTKIICVGDIHARDRAPANAHESYMDDTIEALLWVNEFAQHNSADAIVWAGDVFDHKLPSRTSHALVLRMIDVVHDALSRGVEIWAVVGNHDISNDVLASITEKQPLGVLYKAGLRELNGWHPTLPLFGVPWRQDWTTNEDSADEAFKEYREYGMRLVIGEEDIVDPEFDEILAVTHAPIYPPKEAENIQWELVPTRGPKGISAAMGNRGFLYYGHIHEDHGVFEVDGVTYANMGAISRGSMAEYNLNRKIKVAMWTEAGFEEVAVPHKPASEVLKVVEATAAKEERLSLDQFLTEVGSVQLDISSTASVIEHIKGRKDVDPGVRKRAIEILEEVG